MTMLTVDATAVDLTDKRALKARLRKAEAAQRLRAFMLVLPLLAFVVVTFVVPIGIMLARAVENPEVLETLPRTLAVLEDWDGSGLPPEAAYAALAADLKDAQSRQVAGTLGKRLNYEITGTRSDVVASARAASRLRQGPYKQAMIDIAAMWGERDVWRTLKRAGTPLTPFYLLAALDLRIDLDRGLTGVNPDEALFRDVFVRTFGISVTVTLATLLLGFPVAYLMATLPVRHSNILMILVLLPFWTSILVRTTAWVVLLQTNGVVNDILIALHLTPQRLQLIFTRFGTIVAMTHIQLPFTLLPIYSVMRTIPPSLVRAAVSLGAGPFTAFWRIYVPQTIPGVAGGCLLTFILCLGYYITPTLVGGPTDQMVSSYVALYMNRELNWGMAGALGAMLLAATLILYAVYNRLVGIDKLKLG